MQKIGFFGGCFNPPTNIHIGIANKLIKDKILDKVIFVPVNDFYSKESLIEAEHRYNMLKLATSNYKNLDVDNFEIIENKKMYAIDAFETITEKYKDSCELFFIMGSDNYENMHNWKAYDKIKKNYKYIVIERNWETVNSTIVRNLLKQNNEKAKECLDKSVYEYIKLNKLYI